MSDLSKNWTELKAAYNAKGKINLLIIAVFFALLYFLTLVPGNSITQADAEPVAPIKYTELFGGLLINVNKDMSNKECEALIIKNVNRPNIDKISIFDINGQVCFSNLKRDSGIVFIDKL